MNKPPSKTPEINDQCPFKNDQNAPTFYRSIKCVLHFPVRTRVLVVISAAKRGPKASSHEYHRQRYFRSTAPTASSNPYGSPATDANANSASLNVSVRSFFCPSVVMFDSTVACSSSASRSSRDDDDDVAGCCASPILLVKPLPFSTRPPPRPSLLLEQRRCCCCYLRLLLLLLLLLFCCRVIDRFCVYFFVVEPPSFSPFFFFFFPKEELLKVWRFFSSLFSMQKHT